MRLFTAFLLALPGVFFSAGAAYSQSIWEASNAGVNPARDAVSPYVWHTEYNITGSPHVTVVSSDDGSGSVRSDLLQMLSVTCNISPATGWTIVPVQAPALQYVIEYFGAWAENTPNNILWYGNPGPPGVPVPQQNFMAPTGGSAISVLLTDQGAWETNPGVHWISFVVANYGPPAQPCITSQPYGGASPTYSFVDQGNRQDGLPWYDFTDAQGNLVPAPNGQFVLANPHSFVDLPGCTVPPPPQPLPNFFAETYAAWLSGPTTLNIAYYGFSWGFCGLGY